MFGTQKALRLGALMTTLAMLIWALPAMAGAPSWPCDPLVDSYSSIEDYSRLHFGQGDLPELPADFFFTGSRPFAGQVAVMGVPLDPAVGDSNLVLRRSAGLSQANDGVEIQLQKLRLAALSPLKVESFGGATEEWLMSVTLAEGQPVGKLSARFASAAGGSFSADVPYLPQLVFVSGADLELANQGLIDFDQVDRRTFDFADRGLAPMVLALRNLPFSTASPNKAAVCRGAEARTFWAGLDAGGNTPAMMVSEAPFTSQRQVFRVGHAEAVSSKRATQIGGDVEIDTNPIGDAVEIGTNPIKLCKYKHTGTVSGANCTMACPSVVQFFKSTQACGAVTNCYPITITFPLPCGGNDNCIASYDRHACVQCN